MKAKCLISLSAIIAFIFYYFTCFRTFTWWDSSEYSLAALTFGIPHPPGSLLTVLLGRAVVILPLGIDKFFILNLLAAAMAAIIVYVIGNIASRILDKNDSDGPDVLVILAISLSALFLGFIHTNWYYAIRFTPYIMTALFTALILFSIFQWIKNIDAPRSHLYFAFILLLFGLDFSVHRSNLLMMPAVLFWLALYKSKGFISLKYYIYGIGAFVTGLAVQLINIPLSTAHPFLNANNPDNLARFWDYVSLKQYGGGWLINMFPRKAPFWSVQITDYWDDFASNFFNNSLRGIGYLPLLLGIFGMIMIFRKSRKLALGLLSMFLLASLGAITYFNLAENFFRSIDRHYMPSFVIFGLFVVYGVGALVRLLSTPITFRRRWVLIVCLALIILLPVQAIMRNYRDIDSSNSRFAYDFAKNFLSGLPENSIIYTQSDIDTFVPWCLQIAENYRTDVTICNTSLMNTPWFFEQVLELDKNYPYRPSKNEIETSSVLPWDDSTLAIPYYSDTGSVRDTVNVTVSPSLSGKYLLVSDQILYKTLANNYSDRPICFSTMLPEQSIHCLRPFLRLDGIYFRFVPDSLERESFTVLKRNLIDNYLYDGYAYNRLTKEDPTRWVGWNYSSSFLTLAAMQQNSGDTSGCTGTIAMLKSVIHPENIGAPEQLLQAIDNACK